VATEAENIQTAIDNVAQQLADLTRNPKPSYSENGRSVSWGEHFNNLLAAQKQLREELQRALGPYTVYT
jgi:hypothetical protein